MVALLCLLPAAPAAYAETSAEFTWVDEVWPCRVETHLALPLDGAPEEAQTDGSFVVESANASGRIAFGRGCLPYFGTVPFSVDHLTARITLGEQNARVQPLRYDRIRLGNHVPAFVEHSLARILTLFARRR